MPRKKSSKELTVGRKIKKARTDKKISLYDMANETGMSIEYIKELESGKAMPSVGTLLQISKALQIDSGLLFKDQEDNAENRVKTACRLLEDHGHLIPAQLDHLRLAQLGQIAALEENLARYDLAGRAQQAHDRQGGHALAAPRFTYQAQHLAAVNGEIDAVDGLNHPILGVEVGFEAIDFDEGFLVVLSVISHRVYCLSVRLRRRFMSPQRSQRSQGIQESKPTQARGLDHETAKSREGAKHEDREEETAFLGSSRFVIFDNLRSFVIQTPHIPQNVQPE